MTFGEKLIEDAIRRFEKEGYPISVVRAVEGSPEIPAVSFRVALIDYLAAR